MWGQLIMQIFVSEQGRMLTITNPVTHDVHDQLPPRVQQCPRPPVCPFDTGANMFGALSRPVHALSNTSIGSIYLCRQALISAPIFILQLDMIWLTDLDMIWLTGRYGLIDRWFPCSRAAGLGFNACGVCSPAQFLRGKLCSDKSAVERGTPVPGDILNNSYFPWTKTQN